MLYAWSRLIWCRYKCCKRLEVHHFVSTWAASERDYLSPTNYIYLGTEEVYPKMVAYDVHEVEFFLCFQSISDQKVCFFLSAWLELLRQPDVTVDQPSLKLILRTTGPRKCTYYSACFQ